MPPRKNPKTETAAVVPATAPVAPVVAAPAETAAPKKKSTKTYRIVTEGEHAVVSLAGSPAPVFDVPAAEGAKKRTTDRRVVQAATYGAASKKAFSKLVRNCGRPECNLSFRFSIQEVTPAGDAPVQSYEGHRTRLAEPRVISRTGKEGPLEILSKFDVKVTSLKPRRTGAAKADAAPAAAAPAPVAAASPSAPKGKGKGKGKQ